MKPCFVRIGASTVPAYLLHMGETWATVDYGGWLETVRAEDVIPK